MLTREQRVVATHFRIPFLKPCGFTLIETLLVLAVATVIIMMGINRFQQYREELQINAVKSDIQIISAALDSYFYATPCVSHAFPDEKKNPSMTDLGLSTRYNAREPFVISYRAQVVDSSTGTADGMPIYLLKIIATLDSNLSTAQLSWYQQLFNAG